jgi:hypothetical protein
VLDPGPQTASVAHLVQLVGQGNQLLAVLAFRSLLSVGLAQPDWVRAQLARVGGAVCSVFGYLTIVIAGPNVSRPYVSETLAVLDTAGEPTLRALVLGAFAAGLFARDAAAAPRVSAVLKKAKQRLLSIGVAIDTDPQLSWIFERVSL